MCVRRNRSDFFVITIIFSSFKQNMYLIVKLNATNLQQKQQQQQKGLFILEQLNLLIRICITIER